MTESALTANQKSLLEVFVLLDGLERTKENGCFFASNSDLMLKSGIGSHHTLAKVIRTFELYKFITRTVGSFEGRQATTYTLDMEAVMNWCEAHPIGAVSKRRKSAPIKSAPTMGAVLQKCPDEMSAKVVELEKKINELETVNKALVGALSKCGIEAVKKAIFGAGIGAVLEEITEKCPTDTDTEKEPYHIQPYSNTIESNDYRADAGETDFNEIEGNTNDGEVNPSNADEVVPSNEGDQTGSVSDFQKIEGNNPDEVDKSQATANKASGSVATPQTVQTTTDEEKTRQNANKGANPVSGNTNLNPEERINQLDALQLWKMNTPNVNPIELATELGKILTNGVTYQSNAYNKAEKVGCYLALYANDLDTLNQIETALTSGHIKKYGTSTVNLNDAFAIQRNYLSNPQTLETSPEPHQSHADHSDKETITNEQKRAQKRPDKAGEGLKVDKAIDALLTKLANLNAQFVAGDHEAAQKAEKLMNKVCKCCGETDAIGVLNWCALNIPTMLEKHGRVLGTNVNLYLSVIPNVIANRRKELLAA